MKKKTLFTLLFLSAVISITAQRVIERTGLRFYEHHSSTVLGGVDFGSGAEGVLSGYDFVNHSFRDSFNPVTQGAFTNGEEANLDMVEHNGPFTPLENFGITSGVSSIWGGTIQGNNSTLWVVAPRGFNYSTVTDVTQISSAYALGTPSNTIDTIQENRVYLAKIRNSDLYVAMNCYNVTNTSITGVFPPYGIRDVYFDFDYKYGTLGLGTTNISVTSITVQGQGGASTINTLGGSLQMVETVFPANATDNSVTWSVSGPATINSSGLLTATENGDAIVTATANDGSGVTGSTTITITNQNTTQNIAVSSIVVEGQGGISTINTLGGSLQMVETVLPANATNNTVTWSVSNTTGSATINTTGLLTATENGNVTVTATANDGSGVTGSTIITITNQSVGIVELNENNISIYPNPSSDFITVDTKTETDLLFVNIYSSNGGIISTHALNKKNRKLNISDLKPGIYILTLLSENGNIHYTQKITKR